MDRTANFYSQPSYHGGGFPIFTGARRQRGGGIFGALKTMLMPIAKSALKRGLKGAVNVGMNVANDMIEGKNFKQSITQHGKRELKNVAQHTMRGVKKAVMPGTAPRKRPVISKAKQKSKRRRLNF